MPGIGRLITFPRCPGTWETSRTRFQSGFNISKKASLVNSPDSDNVVVEQPVVEPKEKTLVDMRMSSEEVSTDLPFVAERSRSRQDARGDRSQPPQKK